MSGSLVHSPADIIRTLLVDLGLGTLPEDSGSWPIYLANTPDSPDSTITVTDTASRKTGRTQFDGQIQEHHGFQVAIRDANHKDGYEKADAIKVALDETIQLDTVSIQENVGHLYNSDLLFIGRVEDYLNKLENLRPADLSGKKTNVENFNEKDIELILKKFEERRGKYLAKLESLNIEVFAGSAFHPRLKQQMRLCDMLYFQAEHDEYHLSRISELIEKYNAAV